MKPIQALLIDPYTRSAQPFSLIDDARNLRAIIGCHTFQRFALEDGNGTTVWHDDEYLIDSPLLMAFFKLPNWAYPVGGRCIATGAADLHGKSLALLEDVARHLAHRIEWVSVEDAKSYTMIAEFIN